MVSINLFNKVHRSMPCVALASPPDPFLAFATFAAYNIDQNAGNGPHDYKINGKH